MLRAIVGEAGEIVPAPGEGDVVQQRGGREQLAVPPEAIAKAEQRAPDVRAHDMTDERGRPQGLDERVTGGDEGRVRQRRLSQRELDVVISKPGRAPTSGTELKDRRGPELREPLKAGEVPLCRARPFEAAVVHGATMSSSRRRREWRK